MRILLTNDDDYTSKGLMELVEMMKPYGRITVVAPKYHQSGMSMSASLGFRPVAARSLGTVDGVEWHYLDGTPASCTKFAIDVVMAGRRPDVCLSGINHGSNSSTAIWYSGTVGAARQGALYGVPSFAVSLDNVRRDADFSAVRKLFPPIFEKIMANRGPGEVVYNVNFPDIAAEDIKGVKVCRQGLEHWIHEFVPYDSGIYEKIGVTPVQLGITHIPEREEGETLYMMAGQTVADPGNDESTDNWANDNGYISVTAHGIFDNDLAEEDRLKGIL